MNSDVSEKTKKMKVFAKGQVVIPIAYRRKYKIEIGDQIDVVLKPDGILLKKPQKGVSVSLTEKLHGILAEYCKNIHSPKKEDTRKAVANGFTQGWKP